MNKKMVFILILSLLLISCNSNGITTETNESVDETNSVTEEKVSDLGDYEYILEGTLLSNEPPHGTSIELNNPLDLKVNVNGKQKEYSFSCISLNNDDVYNYVERSQFRYDEPFILLKQEADISVQIKVDLASFYTSESINAIDESIPLFISSFELLEVDGKKELIDKSDQPYPFETTSDTEDITNRNVIVDLICSDYNIENLRSVLEENLEIENIDFTGDGIQDAICYVNDVTLGFYEMVYITKGDSGLEILAFDGSDYQKYAHSAYFDGTFIHYIYDGSGHGISGKSQSLFVYDNGSIKDTGAGINLGSSEAQPPTPSYPDGYVTETVTTVDFEIAENNYTAFNVIEVTTGSKEYTMTVHFKYNAESKEFDVVRTVIESDSSDDSILLPEDIRQNQTIGGLNVSDVVWKENDSFTLDLNGEVQLSGVIRGSFNEMYMEDEFFFISNEKFEKPITYNFINWEKQIDHLSGAITQTDLLSNNVQKHLLDGNELEVVATVTSYSYGDKSESEGYEQIEILTIELIDDQFNNETADTTVDNSFVDPKTIQVGQAFEGLTVSEIEYEEGRSIQLNLNGNVASYGVLTGVLDNGYGETEFYYTSDDKFNKPIQYTFDSNYSNSIDKFSGNILVGDLSLDSEAKQYILDGNSLTVAGDITQFGHAMLDESEGRQWLKYSVIEIADENWYIHQEESNVSWENEIFTTTNQGDFYVDYSLYNSVIVPMLESKNSNQLDHIEVNFNGESEFKFTVIGILEDVQINYVAYAGEEGEWKNLGTVSNAVVEINANLPTDSSGIFVTGKVLKSNGSYENIKFALDDMRDLSDYDLYLVEN